MENETFIDVITISEIEDMSSVFEGLFGWFYKGTLCALLVFGFLVHRSLHYTFGRLGSRHINDIIVPSLVALEIMCPIYFVYLMAKSMYYPLVNIIGENLCYFMAFGEMTCAMYCQYLSVLIAFFRYMCICHDDFMKKWLSPKVSISPQWEIGRRKVILINRDFCTLDNIWGYN